jgi:hypothetical protein
MAPIFGDRQKATRKPAAGSSTMTSGVDKPAFVFNAPSSTQSNGFFRTQEQQALPQNQVGRVKVLLNFRVLKAAE